jgi:hypothetical protein
MAENLNEDIRRIFNIQIDRLRQSFFQVNSEQQRRNISKLIQLLIQASRFLFSMGCGFGQLNVHPIDRMIEIQPV